VPTCTNEVRMLLKALEKETRNMLFDALAVLLKQTYFYCPYIYTTVSKASETKLKSANNIAFGNEECMLDSIR